MAARSAARKKATSVSSVKNKGVKLPHRFRKGVSGNPSGRPKGAKNKTTQLQILAARDAFAPMAKMALDKGNAHLEKCKLDGCGSCQWWGNIAFQYHYGKPMQPVEFDAVALRTELESIATAAGKSVEEITQEARAIGVRVEVAV